MSHKEHTGWPKPGSSVAVCCSVLRCVAVLCVAMSCRVPWQRQVLFGKYTAAHCNRACNTLCSGIVGNIPSPTLRLLPHTSMQKGTLRHTATHCNTLQHTAREPPAQKSTSHTSHLCVTVPSRGSHARVRGWLSTSHTIFFSCERALSHTHPQTFYS